MSKDGIAPSLRRQVGDAGSLNPFLIDRNHQFDVHLFLYRSAWTLAASGCAHMESLLFKPKTGYLYRSRRRPCPLIRRPYWVPTGAEWIDDEHEDKDGISACGSKSRHLKPDTSENSSRALTSTKSCRC